MSNLPLKPLSWTEISEKVRNDPSVCELDKGALWIADDNLIFRYNIKNNPDSKELPFIVNYGGRQPKEVDSIEYGKHWAENTHYASQMQPYILPEFISVDEKLPEQNTRVLVLYHAHFDDEEITEFDICTAFFRNESFDVKDQSFYTKRQIKVVGWKAIDVVAAFKTMKKRVSKQGV
ncbi:hypothetical protein [uncultured Psychrobacter sp.]|uniref:hypothetical protein n=1 Tax=uncultured Psychrobacter sp. TaxID=259303 RepID=UPI0030D76858|tara:strand:+ start:1143 stop:1673 length:531 start_codon:yes stop_codon:yes gene_type:complete